LGKETGKPGEKTHFFFLGEEERRKISSGFYPNEKEPEVTLPH